MMTTTDLLLKKGKNIGRLIEEVSLYYTTFREPMPLRILSCKFARAFEKVGGFHDVVRELENDGSISLDRQKSGKTLVYPGAGGGAGAHAPAAAAASVG